MAVGPNGPVSIVGLTQVSSNPYESGPQLVGARLTEMSAAGDFSPPALSNSLPNDDLSYFGDDAEIGRAHVCTTVTNAHLVCRLLPKKKNNTNLSPRHQTAQA